MSIQKASDHLAKFGLETKIKTFTVSSATVELAAAALGCSGERIAKTLSFAINGGCILIVAAGDAKIDNSAFKAQFGVKASMLAFDAVEPMVGHGVGGVCPFGVNEGVKVYLDKSLKRFETVFPACGSASSAVELTISELEMACNSPVWVDVCKAWQE